MCGRKAARSKLCNSCPVIVIRMETGTINAVSALNFGLLVYMIGRGGPIVFKLNVTTIIAVVAFASSLARAATRDDKLPDYLYDCVLAEHLQMTVEGCSAMLTALEASGSQSAAQQKYDSIVAKIPKHWFELGIIP